MSEKLSRFNTQHVVNSIVKWGTRILFWIAIIILAVLSFVDSFDIRPSIKNITTIALIGAVFNYLVWDSYYKSNYEQILANDLTNKDYCIHKRYYYARRGWKYVELQDKIREYNKDFEKAWLQDVVDITGRSIDEIKSGSYRKESHKFLIWRIKHHKYPKTGLRTPRDVLYILSVGKSDSMKVHTKAEEHYHATGRMTKLFTTMLGMLLVASLAYEFIDGNLKSAIITMLLNIAMLFTSLFFGSTSGINGGKLKLSTAEEVSERLEEWKGETPKQEPYQETDKKETDKETKERTPEISVV